MRVIGWLDRRPLLLSALAAAGFLGLVHAVFLFVPNRNYIGPEALFGLGLFGLLVAGVTMLLAAPFLLLLRRRLPSWRAGDPLRASWSLCFGLVVGLVGWMVADYFAPGRVAVAIAVLLALVAPGLQPSLRWLRAAALTTVGLIVVLFAASFALGPAHPQPPAADKGAAAAAAESPASKNPRPDVVLVSVDTLRADHLGAYGRAPTITPAMDRVAREGVVCERGLASSPWTLPSIASLMTGLPTLRHSAGRPLGPGMTYRRSPLEGKFVTLAERFAAAGYRTRAVTSNSFAGAEFGLHQGFQEFANPFEGGMAAGFLRAMPLTRLIVDLTPPEKWGDYRASGITDIALRWLEAADDRPLFLWVHYIDPHVPYQSDPERLDPALLAEMMRQPYPPVLEDGTVVGDVFVGTELVRNGMLWLGPRDRQRLQDYYAREVAYADRHIGRLFDALRARSAKRRVVAALTADHGEELWDHGEFEHGHDYFREITWVPLLFWAPDVIPPGRRVDSVAGLVDVAPTLLDLAGLSPPPAASPDEGRSLAPHWTSGALPPLPRFCGGNLYGLPAVAAEDGPWKFVLRANGAQELYDVTRDPQERRNLAFERADISSRFRAVLDPQLAALLHTDGDGARQEMTPEQVEALKALGYVR